MKLLLFDVMGSRSNTPWYVCNTGQLHSVGLPLTSLDADTFHMGFSTSIAGGYSHLSHKCSVVQCTNPSPVVTTAPSHSKESISLEVEPEGALEARIKKKVAMWVGYVGTHYKGMEGFLGLLMEVRLFNNVGGTYILWSHCN